MPGLMALVLNIKTSNAGSVLQDCLHMTIQTAVLIETLWLLVLKLLGLLVISLLKIKLLQLWPTL
jgi:hypothetical protein